MKLRNLLAVLALIFVCQGTFAQAYYDSNVNQYCYRANSHRTRCWKESETEGSVYGGLLLSRINGNEVNELNKNLFGFDVGVKFSYLFGRSCFPLSLLFELNGYIDLRYALKGGTDTDNDDSAAQIAFTPGIRINFFSVDLGPYIGYARYTKYYFEDGRFSESESESVVSGLDYGLRAGISFHFNKIELGIHWDHALSDHSKRFKKNDFMLSVGYKFKSM